MAGEPAAPANLSALARSSTQLELSVTPGDAGGSPATCYLVAPRAMHVEIAGAAQPEPT
jgi:hypothetical protein